MRFGDPSSPRLQPHHRATISSLLLDPQQVLAPTAALVARPPPYWHQSPAHQLQPQSETRSYGGVESSPGDCIRSSIGAWRLGATSSNATAALTPSVAPKRSNLSISGSAEEFRPFSLSRFSAVESPSTPIASTSQNESGSLNPYTSTLLRKLRADGALSRLIRDDVRARLLRRGPADPDLLMSAESSAYVVELLAAGNRRIRRSVLAKVGPIVHKVMGSSEGHAVFLALLRASEGLDELEGIVEAVCNRKGFLMPVVQTYHGEKALEELIRAVARKPQLHAYLISGLLGEGLLEERKGPLLIHQCFTLLPYENCKIIIREALATIDKMLSSPFGWRCLAECLANATDAELQDLEEIIVTRASVFAKYRHSSLFLQHILGCGSEQLKVRIAEREGSIVELSVHELGNYVVQACFLRTASLEALWRVLDAFLGLPDGDLAVLARGRHSNYVLRKLLQTGNYYFPAPTTELATRIEALPPAVWAINELFH